MFIIGLTGGIGSGKTTVSDLFGGLGITIADADVSARYVVEPNREALTHIQNHFGSGVINPDGSLHRQALRKIVFDDAKERSWLEKLLHPLIRQHLSNQLKLASSPYAILSSPLLLETDQHQLVNRTLIVDTPEDLQLQRACARDGANPIQIKAIMATQMSRKERCSRADDIILNDTDIEALEAKVFTLHKHYLKLASEASTSNDKL